jgi:RND superfamily putative drug exporter
MSVRPDAPARRPGLFERVGRFCARHPRTVVATWALMGLVALPLAPRTADVLQPGGFSLETLDSERTVHLLQQEIGLPPSALVIVIQGENGLLAGEPAFEEAAVRALIDVPAAQHVAGLLTHRLAPRQVSADRSTVYEVVALDLPPDDSPDAVAPIQAALHPQPGLKIGIAGGPAFYGDIQAVSEQDLRRSELISLPLAALALLLVFGSVVAAAVPVIVGGASVLVALGAIFIAASLTPMSIFVLNLATLLGFGLGVDYALLLSSRFREELDALKRRRATAGPNGAALADAATERADIEAAIAVTVATAGRAVFFSGLTVMLGLIGLMLFEFMVLRSVGIAGAIVLVLAVSGALTLLPAILSILGTRLDALPVSRFLPRRLRRATPTPEGIPQAEGRGFWWRLANRVMDRPVAVFLPTLALLLILGLPFLHARFNAADASILPTHVPSKVAFEALATHFPEGDFAPLLLAVRTSGVATGPENIARLYEYSRRLAADPRISRVESIVDVDPRLGLTQYQLLLSNPAGPGDRSIEEALRRTTRADLTSMTIFSWYGPNAPQARALVHDLRDPASAIAPPQGVAVQVGGGAAEVADVVARMAEDFPRSAAFIVIATYLVLFVLLRSVVLPAKALVMNALSIVASFGALVWIFQDGNLSALLGFQPLGFVETTLPVILFCVLFGLSMDYEVFLLTRMKEAWDRTGDNREAVARGLERSGRIVTSAALIVVLVASSFSAAEIVLIKALGIGVAIAVALDATVVRALLVPSTMRLLGKWNWWMPAWLERRVASRLPVVSGLLALSVATVLVVSACTPGAAILANPTNPPVVLPSRTPAPPRPVDPQPVVLPRDDGPHNRMTEWWYDTGHLRAADGRAFGFELVIFRAERGSLPVSWASHFAITDETGKRFLYDQRSEIGPQVNRPGTSEGFDLAIRGDTSPGFPNTEAQPWTMRGANGRDQLLATGMASGVAFGIDLALDAGARPVALHDHDGYVDFGPAGGSYYYSRTRMAAIGTLTLDGQPVAVTGEAWFDHQWGDFIAVGGGGWDWFAMNLDDGTDITLSLVRAADGSYPLVYGTRVAPDGTVEHLDRSKFSVEATDQWTSPGTGAVYPSGWHITFTQDNLSVDLRPTVNAQELDTRPTTGVVYWEGSQVVSATRNGESLGGQAYVELTGYGPGH